MSLEDDIRAALRREPAPEGFAERVLAKAAEAEMRVVPLRQRPLAFALAAALAAAAVIPAGVYEYREHQRGIEARNQLVQAFAITRIQLQQAKGKIRQATKRRL